MPPKAPPPPPPLPAKVKAKSSAPGMLPIPPGGFRTDGVIKKKNTSLANSRKDLPGQEPYMPPKFHRNVVAAIDTLPVSIPNAKHLRTSLLTGAPMIDIDLHAEERRPRALAGVTRRLGLYAAKSKNHKFPYRVDANGKLHLTANAERAKRAFVHLANALHVKVSDIPGHEFVVVDPTSKDGREETLRLVLDELNKIKRDSEDILASATREFGNAVHVIAPLVENAFPSHAGYRTFKQHWRSLKFTSNNFVRPASVTLSSNYASHLVDPLRAVMDKPLQNKYPDEVSAILAFPSIFHTHSQIPKFVQRKIDTIMSDVKRLKEAGIPLPTAGELHINMSDPIREADIYQRAVKSILANFKGAKERAQQPFLDKVISVKNRIRKLKPKNAAVDANNAANRQAASKLTRNAIQKAVDASNAANRQVASRLARNAIKKAVNANTAAKRQQVASKLTRNAITKAIAGERINGIRRAQQEIMNQYARNQKNAANRQVASQLTRNAIQKAVNADARSRRAAERDRVERIRRAYQATANTAANHQRAHTARAAAKAAFRNVAQQAAAAARAAKKKKKNRQEDQAVDDFDRSIRWWTRTGAPSDPRARQPSGKKTSAGTRNNTNNSNIVASLTGVTPPGPPRGRGTSTALKWRGTNTALNWRGTSTNWRGTSTGLNWRDNGNGLNQRGTSTNWRGNGLGGRVNVPRLGPSNTAAARPPGTSMAARYGTAALAGVALAKAAKWWKGRAAATTTNTRGNKKKQGGRTRARETAALLSPKKTRRGTTY